MAGTSALPNASWGDKASAVLRKRVIATPSMAVVNLEISAILARLTWQLIDWAFQGAVWGAEQSAACPDAAGACWSVIAARHRLVLFGLYPYELHWRSTLACVAIVATVVASCWPAMWSAKRLTLLWVTGFAAYYLLMEGSLLGLPR